MLQFKVTVGFDTFTIIHKHLNITERFCVSAIQLPALFRFFSLKRTNNRQKTWHKTGQEVDDKETGDI